MLCIQDLKILGRGMIFLHVEYKYTKRIVREWVPGSVPGGDSEVHFQVGTYTDIDLSHRHLAPSYSSIHIQLTNTVNYYCLHVSLARIIYAYTVQHIYYAWSLVYIYTWLCSCLLCSWSKIELYKQVFIYSHHTYGSCFLCLKPKKFFVFRLFRRQWRQ